LAKTSSLGFFDGLRQEIRCVHDRLGPWAEAAGAICLRADELPDVQQLRGTDQGAEIDRAYQRTDKALKSAIN
jgi:hypothetical protein